MKSYKTLMLATCLLGLSLITGCSTALTNEARINTQALALTKYKVEPPATLPKLAVVLTECVSDLEKVHGDIVSYESDQRKLNKKWYQFWIR